MSNLFLISILVGICCIVFAEGKFDIVNYSVVYR